MDGNKRSSLGKLLSQQSSNCTIPQPVLNLEASCHIDADLHTAIQHRRSPHTAGQKFRAARGSKRDKKPGWKYKIKPSTSHAIRSKKRRVSRSANTRMLSRDSSVQKPCASLQIQNCYVSLDENEITKYYNPVTGSYTYQAMVGMEESSISNNSLGELELEETASFSSVKCYNLEAESDESLMETEECHQQLDMSNIIIMDRCQLEEELNELEILRLNDHIPTENAPLQPLKTIIDSDLSSRSSSPISEITKLSDTSVEIEVIDCSSANATSDSNKQVEPSECSENVVPITASKSVEAISGSENMECVERYKPVQYIQQVEPIECIEKEEPISSSEIVNYVQKVPERGRASTKKVIYFNAISDLIKQVKPVHKEGKKGWVLTHKPSTLENSHNCKTKRPSKDCNTDLQKTSSKNIHSVIESAQNNLGKIISDPLNENIDILDSCINENVLVQVESDLQNGEEYDDCNVNQDSSVDPSLENSSNENVVINDLCLNQIEDYQKNIQIENAKNCKETPFSSQELFTGVEGLDQQPFVINSGIDLVYEEVVLCNSDCGSPNKGEAYSNKNSPVKITNVIKTGDINSQHQDINISQSLPLLTALLTSNNTETAAKIVEQKKECDITKNEVISEVRTSTKMLFTLCEDASRVGTEQHAITGGHQDCATNAESDDAQPKLPMQEIDTVENEDILNSSTSDSKNVLPKEITKATLPIFHYVCLICNKKFNILIHVIDHIKRDHTVNPLYACDSCESTFKSLKKLYNHLHKSHLSEKRSTNQLIKVKNQINIRKIEENLSNKLQPCNKYKYVCNTCNLKCKTIAKYNLHIQTETHVYWEELRESIMRREHVIVLPSHVAYKITQLETFLISTDKDSSSEIHDEPVDIKIISSTHHIPSLTSLVNKSFMYNVKEEPCSSMYNSPCTDSLSLGDIPKEIPYTIMDGDISLEETIDRKVRDQSPEIVPSKKTLTELSSQISQEKEQYHSSLSAEVKPDIELVLLDESHSLLDSSKNKSSNIIHPQIEMIVKNSSDNSVKLIQEYQDTSTLEAMALPKNFNSKEDDNDHTHSSLTGVASEDTNGSIQSNVYDILIKSKNCTQIAILKENMKTATGNQNNYAHDAEPKVSEETTSNNDITLLKKQMCTLRTDVQTSSIEVHSPKAGPSTALDVENNCLLECGSSEGMAEDFESSNLEKNNEAIENSSNSKCSSNQVEHCHSMSERQYSSSLMIAKSFRLQEEKAKPFGETCDSRINYDTPVAGSSKMEDYTFYEVSVADGSETNIIKSTDDINLNFTVYKLENYNITNPLHTASLTPDPNTSYICAYCDKRFTTEYHVELHIDTIHPREIKKFPMQKYVDLGLSTLPCEICNENFDNYSDSMMHYYEFHKRTDKYQCLITILGPYIFTSTGFVYISREMIHRMEPVMVTHKHFEQLRKLNRLFLQCEHCDDVFLNKKLLTAHLSVTHDLFDTCYSNSYKHSKVLAALEPLQIEHGGKTWTRCNRCGFVCPSVVSWLFHQQDHISVNLGHICTYCSEKFDTLPNLATHLQDKHSLKVNINPPKRSNFNRIVKKCNDICYICGFNFSNRYDFDLHLRAYHCISIQMKYCLLCPYTATSIEKVVEHTLAKHKYTIEALTEEEKNKFENKLVCDYCGNKLKTKVTLRNHMKFRHKEEMGFNKKRQKMKKRKQVGKNFKHPQICKRHNKKLISTKKLKKCIDRKKSSVTNLIIDANTGDDGMGPVDTDVNAEKPVESGALEDKQDALVASPKKLHDSGNIVGIIVQTLPGSSTAGDIKKKQIVKKRLKFQETNATGDEEEPKQQPETNSLVRVESTAKIPTVNIQKSCAWKRIRRPERYAEKIIEAGNIVFTNENLIYLTELYSKYPNSNLIILKEIANLSLKHACEYCKYLCRFKYQLSNHCESIHGVKDKTSCKSPNNHVFDPESIVKYLQTPDMKCPSLCNLKQSSEVSSILKEEAMKSMSEHEKLSADPQSPSSTSSEQSPDNQQSLKNTKNDADAVTLKEIENPEKPRIPPKMSPKQTQTNKIPRARFFICHSKNESFINQDFSDCIISNDVSIKKHVRCQTDAIKLVLYGEPIPKEINIEKQKNRSLKKVHHKTKSECINSNPIIDIKDSIEVTEQDYIALQKDLGEPSSTDTSITTSSGSQGRKKVPLLVPVSSFNNNINKGNLGNSSKNKEGKIFKLKMNVIKDGATPQCVLVKKNVDDGQISESSDVVEASCQSESLTSERKSSPRKSSPDAKKIRKESPKSLLATFYQDRPNEEYGGDKQMTLRKPKMLSNEQMMQIEARNKPRRCKQTVLSYDENFISELTETSNESLIQEDSNVEVEPVSPSKKKHRRSANELLVAENESLNLYLPDHGQNYVQTRRSSKACLNESTYLEGIYEADTSSSHNTNTMQHNIFSSDSQQASTDSSDDLNELQKFMQTQSEVVTFVAGTAKTLKDRQQDQKKQSDTEDKQTAYDECMKDLSNKLSSSVGANDSSVIATSTQSLIPTDLDALDLTHDAFIQSPTTNKMRNIEKNEEKSTQNVDEKISTGKYLDEANIKNSVSSEESSQILWQMLDEKLRYSNIVPYPKKISCLAVSTSDCSIPTFAEAFENLSNFNETSYTSNQSETHQANINDTHTAELAYDQLNANGKTEQKSSGSNKSKMKKALEDNSRDGNSTESSSTESKKESVRNFQFHVSPPTPLDMDESDNIFTYQTSDTETHGIGFPNLSEETGNEGIPVSLIGPQVAAKRLRSPKARKNVSELDSDTDDDVSQHGKSVSLTPRAKRPFLTRPTRVYAPMHLPLFNPFKETIDDIQIDKKPTRNAECLTSQTSNEKNSGDISSDIEMCPIDREESNSQPNPENSLIELERIIEEASLKHLEPYNEPIKNEDAQIEKLGLETSRTSLQSINKVHESVSDEISTLLDEHVKMKTRNTSEIGDLCYKEFMSSCSIARHKKTHHDIDMKVIKCQNCMLMSFNDSNFDKHLKECASSILRNTAFLDDNTDKNVQETIKSTNNSNLFIKTTDNDELNKHLSYGRQTSDDIVKSENESIPVILHIPENNDKSHTVCNNFESLLSEVEAETEKNEAKESMNDDKQYQDDLLSLDHELDEPDSPNNISTHSNNTKGPIIYCCSECEKLMGNEKAVKDHLKRNHGIDGQEVLICNICYFFTVKCDVYKNHVLTHEAFTRNPTELQNILTVQSSATSTVATAKDVKSNRNMHFYCSECSDKIRYFEAAKLHIKEKHNISTMNFKYCKVCKYFTWKSAIFKEHIKIHVNKETEDQLKTDTTPSLNTNSGVRKRQYSCWKCKENFNDYESVHNHIEEYHCVVNNDILICPDCLYFTMESDKFEKHCVAHSSKRLESSKSIKQMKEQLSCLKKCKTCSQKLSSYYNLKRHVMIVHEMSENDFKLHYPCSLELCKDKLRAIERIKKMKKYNSKQKHVLSKSNKSSIQNKPFNIVSSDSCGNVEQSLSNFDPLPSIVSSENINNVSQILQNQNNYEQPALKAMSPKPVTFENMSSDQAMETCSLEQLIAETFEVTEICNENKIDEVVPSLDTSYLEPQNSEEQSTFKRTDFQCYICDKYFKSFYILKTHITNFHCISQEENVEVIDLNVDEDGEPILVQNTTDETAQLAQNNIIGQTTPVENVTDETTIRNSNENVTDETTIGNSNDLLNILTEQMPQVLNKPHKCPLCPRDFLIKGSLTKHINSCHSNKSSNESIETSVIDQQKIKLNNEFKCIRCSNSYPTKSSLNSHTNLKHYDELCKNIFENLEPTQKRQRTDDYLSETSNSSFPMLEQEEGPPTKRLRSKDNDTKEVSLNFSTEKGESQTRMQHSTETSKPQEQPSLPRLACSQCNKLYTRKFYLEDHMRKIHNLEIGSVVLDAQNVVEASLPQPPHDMNFESDSIVDKLIESLTADANTQPATDESYYTDYENLEKYIGQPSNYDSVEQSSAIHQEEGMILESSMETVELFKDQLKRPTRQSVGSNSLQLVNPDEEIEAVETLASVPEKPFQCPCCSTSYTRKSRLSEHLMKIHNKELTVNKKDLQQKESETIHGNQNEVAELGPPVLEKEVVEDAPLCHPCLMCDKSYAKLESLRRHLRRIHNKRWVSFNDTIENVEDSTKTTSADISTTNVCSQKDNRWNSPSHIDSDELLERLPELDLEGAEEVLSMSPIPQVDNPAVHKCTLCEKTFGKKRGVKDHLKRCHSVDTQKVVVTAKTPSAAEFKKELHGMQLHSCKFCGNSYALARSLKKHIETKHSIPENSKTAEKEEFKEEMKIVICKEQTPPPPTQTFDPSIEEENSARKSTLRSKKLYIPEPKVSLPETVSNIVDEAATTSTNTHPASKSQATSSSHDNLKESARHKNALEMLKSDKIVTDKSKETPELNKPSSKAEKYNSSTPKECLNVEMEGINDAIEVNKSNMFDCKLCTKTYVKLYNLKEHMKKKHNDWEQYTEFAQQLIPKIEITVEEEEEEDLESLSVGRYPCKLCEKSYSIYKSFRSHMRSKHEGQFNSDVGQVFNLIGDVNIEKPLAADTLHAVTDRLACSICKKSYSRKRDLNDHLKKNHNDMSKTGDHNLQEKVTTTEVSKSETCKPYKCELCIKTFTRKYRLTEHMKKTHTPKIDNNDGQENTPSTSIMNCSSKNTHSIKNSPTKIQKIIETHVDESSEEIGVKNVDKESSKPPVAIPSTSSNKPYACTLCDRSYTRQSFLKDHVKNKHHEETAVEDVLQAEEIPQESTAKQSALACKLCNNKYANNKSLKKHIKYKHPIKSEKLETRSKTGPSPSKKHCTTENETMKSPGVAETTKNKTGEKECNKESKKEVATTNHTCIVCSKVFPSKSFLDHHVSRRHSEKTKLFSCKCGKKFRFAMLVKRHQNNCSVYQLPNLLAEFQEDTNQ